MMAQKSRNRTVLSIKHKYMNTKLKIAVVDDDRHIVADLSKAVKEAGFEAVSIVVEPGTSLSEVLKKVSATQMVLLDHQMHGFSGEDVAKDLPDTVCVVTTSDHKRTDAYCAGRRLYGKCRHPFPLKSIVESIKGLVSEL
jgi:DNA-binding NtrC family response regulator